MAKTIFYLEFSFPLVVLKGRSHLSVSSWMVELVELKLNYTIKTFIKYESKESGKPSVMDSSFEK